MEFFVIGSYMNANFMGVPRLPVEGESLAATSVWTEHGGKGLNLGVGLHRLGALVDMLLAVGNDAAGNAVHDRLQREGMRTHGVVRLGERSGYGVGFVGPKGENFLAAFSGANALLTPAHVEEAMAPLAYSGWVCAQFEAPMEPIMKAFELARLRGWRTYLNPSPWHISAQILLASTDVLVVNATEAAALFDTPSAETWCADRWTANLPALAEGLGWHGELLVVTLGAMGALALSESANVTHQPAWVINQVDATGAGDAFGCGLLWALSQNLPLQQTLQIANACGAMVAAASGVLDALPNRQQLDAFLSQRKVVCEQPAEKRDQGMQRKTETGEKAQFTPSK